MAPKIYAYPYMVIAEQFFRALGDGTRLRVMLLLRLKGRLCVCELVHALDAGQPRVSRHLGHLRDLGLVRDERRGQWVYYEINPALPDWALNALDAVAEAEKLKPLAARLASMNNRPIAACD